jgi:hypothetical protein
VIEKQPGFSRLNACRVHNRRVSSSWGFICWSRMGFGWIAMNAVLVRWLTTQRWITCMNITNISWPQLQQWLAHVKKINIETFMLKVYSIISLYITESYSSITIGFNNELAVHLCMFLFCPLVEHPGIHFRIFPVTQVIHVLHTSKIIYIGSSVHVIWILRAVHAQVELTFP